MFKDEAMAIICDFHGRKIELFNGKIWKKHTIKRIIPIRLYSSGQWGKVDDVEILTSKKNNHYFSIKMFLKNESWVKGIDLGDINFSVKGKMKVISNVDKFDDEDWKAVANFITAMKNISSSAKGSKA